MYRFILAQRFIDKGIALPELLKKRIQQLQRSKQLSTLQGIRRGIEKESMRVSALGEISQTPHPTSLGSALTHPSITTDYSEALLEFITPVYQDPSQAINYLVDVHAFTYQNINDEKLWSTSMPCILKGEMSIPIADYGTSNIGRLKHVYRHGLWHRYGRFMQTIAGIHYNFSMPDSFWLAMQSSEERKDSLQSIRSDYYFALVRNFRRYSWLLLYLFGASPALCKSFLNGREHDLESLDENSLFAPHGTSLRMSDLGYQNSTQSSLNVSFNSLEGYVTSLDAAIKTTCAEYETIGVKNNDQYMQLSTNILQIENEYYSDIRPKRVAQSGERPSSALKLRGVEYIEVRCLDLNPFLPVGIDVEQVKFLDVFLLTCLLLESPQISEDESKQIRYNIDHIAYFGRESDLRLFNQSTAVSAKSWSLSFFENLAMVAEVMDGVHGGMSYRAAVESQKEKVLNPELTPSAQVINTMRKNNWSYYQFANELSTEHERYFKSKSLNESVMSSFIQQAQESLNQQEALEASDKVSFDDFVTEYMA